LLALTFGLLRERSAALAAQGDSSPSVLPRGALYALLLLAAEFAAWFRDGAALVGTILAVVACDSLGVFAAPQGGWLARCRLRLTPRQISLAFVLAWAYLQIDGIAVSMSRQVHEAFAKPKTIAQLGALKQRSEFPAVLAEPRLGGLKWGRHTLCGDTVVPKRSCST